MFVQFKTDYQQDINFLVHPGERFRVVLIIALALAAPIILDAYFIGELALLLVYAIAGLGLMVLTGFTGQVSFGHAAFLGIGAYAHTVFLNAGIPFWIALPSAGLLSAIAGWAIGRAASHMHGFYLAIATLAFAIITETVIGALNITGGHMGLSVPAISLLGYELIDAWQQYYLILAILLFFIWSIANLMRSPTGRALIAVRDSETSARSLGVNIRYYKILSFFISAFITGIAGGLLAHLLYYLSPETFGVMESLKLLLMIIVGGLGSITGALFGAVFISLLPNAIDLLKLALPSDIANQPGLQQLIFGLLIALVIMFEPKGLYGRWMKIRLFLETFPYYKKSTFVRQKQYLKTERLR